MTFKPATAYAKDKRTASDGVKLQHRHFSFIAAVIKGFGWPQERDRLAQHFANECQHTNPNFDRPRFLKACGCDE